MGEVLKILKETKIAGGKFLIELNHPDIIHIQNEKFRLEMPQSEFLKIAGAIAWSRKKFDVMKGWKAK